MRNRYSETRCLCRRGVVFMCSWRRGCGERSMRRRRGGFRSRRDAIRGRCARCCVDSRCAGCRDSVRGTCWWRRGCRSLRPPPRPEPRDHSPDLPSARFHYVRIVASALAEHICALSPTISEAQTTTTTEPAPSPPPDAAAAVHRPTAPRSTPGSTAFPSSHSYALLVRQSSGSGMSLKMGPPPTTAAA